MKNIQDNEYVICKRNFEDSVETTKIFVENGILEIENSGDPIEYDFDKVSVIGLSKLKTLERLILYGFDLHNFLSNNEIPENLIALHLINCHVSTLDSIKYLNKLESFTLTITPLAMPFYKLSLKINEFLSFPLLKTLGISGITLRVVPQLKQLVNLKILILIGDMISKIEKLDKMCNLQELHLQNNLIEKIQGLDNLTKLERLYLYGNKLKVIEGLNSLIKLNFLDLDYNLFFKDKEYKMMLEEAQSYFGHMRNLIMLNNQLYPDHKYYLFKNRTSSQMYRF